LEPSPATFISTTEVREGPGPAFQRAGATALTHTRPYTPHTPHARACLPSNPSNHPATHFR
jgi:hypothetical protein